MAAPVHCLLLVSCLILGTITHGETGSEKQLSELVEDLLHNHNSRMRPGTDSGEPLIVFVNLLVTEIYRISETDMEFSMTFLLRQRWQDERLSYTAFNRSITLNYNQFHKVWTPDLFIRNLKSGHLHDITVPNRLLRLYPNGTLLFSQRLSVTLACDMYLERYPMDNQTCPINLGSYAYTTEDIIMAWDDKVPHPVEVNSKISFPKFDFNGVTPQACKILKTSTGAYPCIEAFFHLERRLKSYVLYIYLPSLLVVVLSWVSFWIDLQAVPARISLGILTILTITTQSVGVNRDLPSVSFTKAIDVWMVVCLVFVFAAFIEYSMVNVLARSNKMARKDSYTALQVIHPRKESDSMTTVKRSASGQLDVGGGSNDLRQRLDSSSQYSPTTCCPPHRHERTVAYSTSVKKNKANNALTVDIVSRVMFPVLFGVFNALYWPFYYWDWVSVLRES